VIAVLMSRSSLPLELKVLEKATSVRSPFSCRPPMLAIIVGAAFGINGRASRTWCVAGFRQAAQAPAMLASGVALLALYRRLGALLKPQPADRSAGKGSSPA